MSAYTENREYIVTHPEEYLTPDNSGKGYLCPLCGSGSGRKGTGLTAIQGRGAHKRFTCWSCHGFKDGGDVLDIIAAQYHTDAARAMDQAMKIYGLDEGAARARSAAKDFEEEDRQEAQPVRADFSAYIAACEKRLQSSEKAQAYLHDRGLTEETIRRFKLGYEEENGHPYIVIPYNASCSYYIKRRLDSDEAGQKYRKPATAKAGKEPLYNAAVITGNEPVFIVEGTFCAMSIEQCGGHAVALNTTGDPKNLLQAIQRAGARFTGNFILALDNDVEKEGRRAGQEGQAKLAAELRKNNIPFIEYQIQEDFKDPNELLSIDPERLRENVAAAIMAAKGALYEDISADSVQEYAARMFYSDIEAFRQGQSIKTGFSELDRLTGGLYAGFYVLGAISGLGKTTFLHQMADQIAKSGKRAIYFSLEQSKMELLSKSITRDIYSGKTKDFEELPELHRLSSLHIRKGEYQNIGEALQSYTRSVGDRLNIVEGNLGTDIEEIRHYIEKYIGYYNERPVVIVDYMQLITNAQEKDPRAKIESTIRALKIMSRDLCLPVIAISNLNRENYNYPVALESFKESGLIEYTADVVWGLQLDTITSPIFIKEKSLSKQRELISFAMSEHPRRIKLCCLKNRYGARYEIGLDYAPQYDYMKCRSDFYRTPPANGTVL